jgi:hypothetical protein
MAAIPPPLLRLKADTALFEPKTHIENLGGLASVWDMAESFRTEKPD